MRHCHAYKICATQNAIQKKTKIKTKSGLRGNELKNME